MESALTFVVCCCSVIKCFEELLLQHIKKLTGLTHKQTTYIQIGSHTSSALVLNTGGPPGLCARPPAVHTVHSWLHHRTSRELLLWIILDDNTTQELQSVVLCHWVNLLKELINPLRLEQVQPFDSELISKTVVVRTDPIPGAFLFLPRQYYCCGWSEHLLLYFVEIFSL